MKMKTLAAVAVATALLCAGQIASAKDKLDSIIAGNIAPVIDALMECERQEQRAAFGTID